LATVVLWEQPTTSHFLENALFDWAYMPVLPLSLALQRFFSVLSLKPSLAPSLTQDRSSASSQISSRVRSSPRAWAAACSRLAAPSWRVGGAPNVEIGNHIAIR
jgi:hypothetical protein